MVRWFLRSLVAFSLVLPCLAQATPTDNYYAWQIWAYVDQYREQNTGDVIVWFEDSNGNRVTNFPNSAGVNQCPNNDGLTISQSHPLFDRLSKAVLTGGLARRLIKVAYEGVNGTCYIKMITIEM